MKTKTNSIIVPAATIRTNFEEESSHWDWASIPADADISFTSDGCAYLLKDGLAVDLDGPSSWCGKGTSYTWEELREEVLAKLIFPAMEHRVVYFGDSSDGRISSISEPIYRLVLAPKTGDVLGEEEPGVSMKKVKLLACRNGICIFLQGDTGRLYRAKPFHGVPESWNGFESDEAQEYDLRHLFSASPYWAEGSPFSELL